MRNVIYILAIISALLSAPFNSAAFTEQRKFAGHEYDDATGLSYMNARYYDGGMGRFVSQDPAFLLLGDGSFEQKYNRTLEQHLSDPQQLNSYSYVTNNPLRHTDETGEIAPLIIAGVLIAWQAAEAGLTAYDGYSTYQTVTNPNASFGEKIGSVGLFGLGLAGPGGGYDAARKQIVKYGDGVVKTAEQWASVSFDAVKQQAQWLKGIENSKLQNIIKDFFKTSDTIPGGTASAIHYTKETENLVKGKDHIEKGQNLLRGLQNVLKQNLSSAELGKTKDLIGRLNKALGK